MANIDISRMRKKKTRRLLSSTRREEKQGEQGRERRRGGREGRRKIEEGVEVYRTIYSAIYQSPGDETGGIGIYIWEYVLKEDVDDSLYKLRRKIQEVSARYDKKYTLEGGDGTWNYDAYSKQRMPSEEKHKLEFAPQLYGFAWNENGEIMDLERKLNTGEDFLPDPTDIIPR